MDSKKTFFCVCCRKHKPDDQRVVSNKRKSVYCFDCDDNATKNIGAVHNKKAKKYTAKQLDNMIDWIASRGG